jgi:hypothetical protein
MWDSEDLAPDCAGNLVPGISSRGTQEAPEEVGALLNKLESEKCLSFFR